MNKNCTKTCKNAGHTIKVIAKMQKQPNFFYSQPSTLSKDPSAKFYLSKTLSFVISFVGPTRSSTFYQYLNNRNREPWPWRTLYSIVTQRLDLLCKEDFDVNQTAALKDLFFYNVKLNWSELHWRSKPFDIYWRWYIFPHYRAASARSEKWPLEQNLT